jgi:hypothetical protein
MANALCRILGLDVCAAVIAAGVLAAVPAFGAADDSLTGRWYSEGFERGEHLQVFLELKDGGDYVKDVRVLDSNCDIAADAKETGKWVFQRNNLTTVSEAVDGKPVTAAPADRHDLYRVDRVDEEHINLFDTETRLTWGLMLVPADYAFPVARGCGV